MPALVVVPPLLLLLAVSVLQLGLVVVVMDASVGIGGWWYCVP
jgi:hypothetical protein